MDPVEKMPPFDPKANCVKCGWSIPDPVVPAPKTSKDAEGKVATLPAPPPPPPTPPTVFYCNGEQCPWDAGNPEAEPTDEHLHQFCDTCGYEWLSAPLG